MPAYILADDLSGGLEVSASFHSAGCSVVMPLGDELTAGGPGGGSTDLIGVNTETRTVAPSVARAIVRRIASRLKKVGGELVYKKVDSTLRGPMGAELDELLTAYPGMRVLFCPATPVAGRTVRDGVLYVGGRPVAETEFAQDPLWPVTDSRVQHVLVGECGVSVSHLPLHALRGDEAADAIAGAFAGGARTVLADAESPDDLETLARLVTGQAETVLPVGSGGLAGALARMGYVVGSHARGDKAELKVASGICLFVCGSAHSINRQQVAVLRAESGLKAIDFNLGAAGACDGGRHDYADAVAGRAAEAAERTGGVILLLETSGLAPVSTAAELQAVTSRQIGLLGEIVRRLDERCRVAQVFATGGETARAVLDALKGDWLRLVDEIEQGLGVTQMFGHGPPRLTVTKPGGFGDEQSMVRVWRWFRARANRRVSESGQ